MPNFTHCFSVAEKVKYTDIAVPQSNVPHRYGNSHAIQDHTVLLEVCMGMGKTGIPWVPWDSHGNGSKISHGMGMGWELSAWEWELRHGSCHQQL